MEGFIEPISWWAGRMDALLSMVGKTRTAITRPVKKMDAGGSSESDRSFLLSMTTSPVKRERERHVPPSPSSKQVPVRALLSEDHEIEELSGILSGLSDEEAHTGLFGDSIEELLKDSTPPPPPPPSLPSTRTPITHPSIVNEAGQKRATHLMSPPNPKRQRLAPEVISLSDEESTPCNGRPLVHVTPEPSSRAFALGERLKGKANVCPPVPTAGKIPNGIITEQEEEQEEHIRKLSSKHSQWSLPPQCLDANSLEILEQLECLLFPHQFRPSALQLHVKPLSGNSALLRHSDGSQDSKDIICGFAVIYSYDSTSFRTSQISVSTFNYSYTSQLIKAERVK